MRSGTAEQKEKSQRVLPLYFELPSATVPLVSGEDLHFFCARRLPGEIPSHRHDQLEISVLFEPAVCSLSWGEPRRPSVLPMTAPAIVLMAPRQWHSFRWEREADVIVIHIDQPLQRELRCTRGAELPTLLQARSDPVIWEIASGLRRLCLDRNPAESRALALVAKSVACRAVELLAKPDTAPTALALSDAEFRRVEDYMLAHLGHEIHIVDLARSVGYSSQHFSALFKARMGITAPAFLMQLRMAKAKERFAAGARTIKTVGESVGYYDAGNFTARFRERFGLSPRTLIEQLRAESAVRPRITSERP